jgi:hypothetical protein
VSEISEAFYEQPIEGEIEWLTLESKHEELSRFRAYRSVLLAASAHGRLCHLLIIWVELASPIKPIFSVPFRRDPYFVERESIFSQIEERAKASSCVSLCGMGGMGFVDLRKPIIASSC